MPHLLEAHFRRFVKHYQNERKKREKLKTKKEIKKESITKSNNDELNFEDFFYENLTIFF